ncbi:unnamed protein product [Oikopleura dioica]|uniref:Uncharacterized protein n=1 Tax=Oikopleura dioica TaxID=34765 RepID=E4YDR7_OIKDI|nr:unnamed protein product [Oikopleura dioica]
MKFRTKIGKREINWAIIPLLCLKLVVFVIWCAVSVVKDVWLLAQKLGSHLLICGVEIFTETKDLVQDYLTDDEESSDDSDSSDSEEHFDRGNPEELYEIFFDESFDLASIDIKELQKEALERQKKQRFQKDFNACIAREKMLSDMPFTLGCLTLFKNYILAASMDILSLLLLISWYFTLWKALLIGTLVHFFVVHFRLLKFFAVNAGKKIWNQVFSYPKMASAEYETIEDIFLRHYGIECYRSTLMKTYQRNQERITGELKIQMSFMEKQIEKKNEEIENLKVSVDVENIYAEECDAMRNKMVTLDIDRALLKSENGMLTRQIKEKSHLIHQKKQQIESMESNQKQHTKELKSLKLKMDDVKFANSKMTKELTKSEKTITNYEFEIKQLKKKLESHQKTKPSPKECVLFFIILFVNLL